MLLLELQRAFHASDTSSVAPYIVAAGMPGVPAEARLDIYRHNTLTNLCNALQADYPVVEKLVGTEFFRHAARSYVSVTQSHSGDINEFGGDFPAFLAAMPAASGLPYLGDVARLEQAWKSCFYAADPAGEIADFALLPALPQERLTGLRFTLHPALRWLSSRYPVLTIWEANQDEAADAGTVDLGEGGEVVLLRRSSGRVTLQRLSPGGYAFLDRLALGASLGEAAEAAFELQEDFDLSDFLASRIAQENFTNYTLGDAS